MITDKLDSIMVEDLFIALEEETKNRRPLNSDYFLSKSLKKNPGITIPMSEVPTNNNIDRSNAE
jgi:hypothetical protein